MKIKPLTLRVPKPRNPLVAAALARKAGAHRAQETTSRQSAAQRLRKELKDLHPPTA